ncbi:hypothetical protein C4565_03740 [Candidatus Parcubacteria bacterium]|nr:MAG: hypothetical protein C4565_03740 [Candidatus Parcubacteria bacterium]
MIQGIAVCDVCKERLAHHKCLLCGCDLCGQCKDNRYDGANVEPLCKPCRNKIDMAFGKRDSGLAREYREAIDKTGKDFIIAAHKEGKIK